MRRPPIKLNELLKRFRAILPSERGQAMIFAAILMPTLALSTGVVVEGGQVYVQYRKLQAAADMAALIGAQKLPCATTDTTCISTAESQACTYAVNNGFAGCVAGGGSLTSADVPPVTCSPYDFIDYGNDNYGGSGNASCKSAASPPPYYDYVETRLTYSVTNIPIFNIPINLYAHAVAKHGTFSGGDFAIISLDPNTNLNIYGNATVITGGSAFANGGVSGNGKNDLACNGGWFAANGGVSGVSTDNNGSPIFAPTGCTGSNDTTPVTQSNLPQLADPWKGTVAPPTQSGSFPNCTECQSSGYWYDGSSWNQGGSIGGHGQGHTYELFPGIYSSLSLGNKDTAIFNPGVYTFTGGIDTNHGNMCIFGSPACSDSTGWCAQQSFSDGSTAGGQWYYACSPYGFWDSNLAAASGGRVPTTPPTFYNSSVQLNGIVFYLPPNAGGITTHGNGGKNGDVYLAAPNACPGTGTFTGGSPPAVSWPQGDASAQYTYSSSDYAYQAGYTQSPASDLIYPNSDFTLLGECNNGLQVWNGEQPQPKHLHFLFWVDPTGNDSTMNGASAQQMTGAVYMPGSVLSINGAGKGAGGPPWIHGQLIVKSASIGGNGYVDVDYRPCGPRYGSCGSGLGTQLIQ